MTYSRDQSILFKTKSPQMLAGRLHISLEKLYELLDDPKPYKIWVYKKSKKPRQIEEPRPKLAKVHKRIAKLLANIETPNYLHSAQKGRSYITNSMAHSANENCAKTDIKDFYQSIRAQEVFHLFRDRMKCAGDVAGILTKLLTINGHLPTGGSASPILSYFAYENMFDELAELAVSYGCKMTVYIDDITFTGKGATKKLLHEARRVIGKYHLKCHKNKIFQSGQPRIITGVAVTKTGNRLPNKNQKKIRKDRRLLNILLPGKNKLHVARRLAGRLYAACQIDTRWQRSAELVSRQRDALHKHFSN